MASARPSPTARVPILRAVVVSCALALATGCGAATEPEAAPSSPEAAARALAAPEPASAAAPEDAAPAEQLLTESPDEFSRVGDLVDGFPIELLPVPGDAVLLVTSAVPVGDSTVQEVSLNFRTAATVDEILELYRTALLDVGFSEIPPTSAQSELAAETTFVRSDGSELVSIGVLEVDAGRTVAIGGRVETATP